MARRLHPLTLNCPKCLLPLQGKTILQRSVEALRDNGVREFVLVLGFKAEMIKDFLLRAFPDLTFHFLVNERYQETNNIYSLYLARPLLEGRRFVLLDSDIIYDEEILTRLFGHKDSVLALNSHALGEEEIKVILDEGGFVKEISKTCSIAKAAGESLGIEVMQAEYSKALFPLLEEMIEREGLDNVFYELAFERLISQGHKFRTEDVSDLRSMEIDTPEDYAAAQRQ